MNDDDHLTTVLKKMSKVITYQSTLIAKMGAQTDSAIEMLLETGVLEKEELLRRTKEKGIRLLADLKKDMEWET